MQAITRLFDDRILPRVADLGVAEIACRVTVVGAGDWQLGTEPARAQVTIDPDALLLLRSTDARDTAKFLREGRLKIDGDQVHALQVVAFLAQGDLFFEPAVAFNTRRCVDVPGLALFRATQSALPAAFPGWRSRLNPPLVVQRTSLNPFTRAPEARTVTEYDPGPEGDTWLTPFEPPLPYVSIPLHYCYPAELLTFFGQIAQVPEETLEKMFENLDVSYEELFPQQLFGGRDVDVLATPSLLRDRLASMNDDEWGEMVPSLFCDEDRENGLELALKALGGPLRALSRTAQQESEQLWLFGRR